MTILVVGDKVNISSIIYLIYINKGIDNNTVLLKNIGDGRRLWTTLLIDELNWWDTRLISSLMEGTISFRAYIINKFNYAISGN